MELKYRGKAKLKQGGKVQEIEVYSNDFNPSNEVMNLFCVEMAHIIKRYYENQKHQKEFEEWKRMKLKALIVPFSQKKFEKFVKIIHNIRKSMLYLFRRGVQWKQKIESWRLAISLTY